MIKVTTKKSTVLISEKEVYSAEFRTDCKELWVRILRPDGKWDSDCIDKVVSVEYIPDNEHIKIEL